MEIGIFVFFAGEALINWDLAPKSGKSRVSQNTFPIFVTHLCHAHEGTFVEQNDNPP